MAHKPDTQRNLSIKSKLVIIAVMFVVINLIFYLGFDSSDESEKSVEFDDKIKFNVEEIPESELEITNPITP
ncbi:hypothetical protein YTPLAS73_05680 [Nitrosarchaeum sp.]|nr:hypothetical protein YTPLAS73_05680 [Nitrosarchaeum sp.]